MDDGWRGRMVQRFGPGVLAWADGVDARAAALAARWSLTLGPPFPTGNTSLTVACTRADGRAAVLKLVPEPQLVADEAAALRAWAPSGAVPALWAALPDALLLERVVPGVRIADRAVPASVDEIAELVGALAETDPPPGLPSLQERLDVVYAIALRRGADPALVARGRAAARSLAGDRQAGRGLLHGDLHPGNVLDGGDRLVAIDPRPCVGDPLFDLVDWVLHDGDPLERAHALAAATGHDPQRLLAWTRATAVLMGPALHSRVATEERVGAPPRD